MKVAGGERIATRTLVSTVPASPHPLPARAGSSPASGPGQWFGEMALLQQTVRTASVRCAAPLDVLSLPREEFSVLAAHLPDLRQRFDRLAAEREAATAADAFPAAAPPAKGGSTKPLEIGTVPGIG